MRTFYIGRNPDNDIVYNDGQVSGRHAEITVGDDGQIIFTDYSTNGSYINGNPIHHASQQVMYGDEIVFPGDIRLDWNMIMPPPQPVNIISDPISGFPPFPPVQDTSWQQSPNAEGLSFSLAFSEGFASGTRNVLRLLAMSLLFVLTCWIPYINVGTFIALSTLSAQYATGNAVNPLSIFDSRFRRSMGNFMILQVLVAAVVFASGFFWFIPALVLFYSWNLASLFVVENGMNPLDAMDASHKCTYGSKWTMFAVHLVYGLCVALILAVSIGIEALILNNIDTNSMSPYIVIVSIFSIIQLIFLLFASSIGIGINGSIWRQLNYRAE